MPAAIRAASPGPGSPTQLANAAIRTPTESIPGPRACRCRTVSVETCKPAPRTPPSYGPLPAAQAAGVVILRRRESLREDDPRDRHRTRARPRLDGAGQRGLPTRARRGERAARAVAAPSAGLAATAAERPTLAGRVRNGDRRIRALRRRARARSARAGPDRRRRRYRPARARLGPNERANAVCPRGARRGDLG